MPLGDRTRELVQPRPLDGQRPELIDESGAVEEEEPRARAGKRVDAEVAADPAGLPGQMCLMTSERFRWEHSPLRRRARKRADEERLAVRTQDLYRLVDPRPATAPEEQVAIEVKHDVVARSVPAVEVRVDRPAVMVLLGNTGAAKEALRDGLPRLGAVVHYGNAGVRVACAQLIQQPLEPGPARLGANPIPPAALVKIQRELDLGHLVGPLPHLMRKSVLCQRQIDWGDRDLKRHVGRHGPTISTGAAHTLTRVSGIGSRLIGRFWRHAEPRFDRRFRPRLRNDPAAPPLLLSPHLDDAVIDCWSVLTAPGELNVVTVCAGIPKSGGATRWDRIAGASDSAELMRARIREDAAALACAGRTGRNLTFVEGHYREYRREPSLRAIDSQLTEVVHAASKAYVPAVLGTPHADHVRVRAYGESLARNGMPLELYADLPYAVVYGWPHWVTGEQRDPHLDVDAYWSGGPGGSARVVVLDDKAAAEKLEAMRAYATQFPTLDRGPIGLLSNPRIHRFEVFWECASS